MKGVNKLEVYSSFFEMSVEGMLLIDKKSAVQANNPGALKILGYDENELIRKNIGEMIPSENHAEFKDLCEQFLKSGKQVSGIKTVMPLITKEKKTIVAEISLGNHVHSEEGPLVIIVFSDASEKVEREMELKSSLEQFYVTFQFSPAPSAITRLSDGHYKEINNAFLEVFGYERTEVIGKTSADLNLYKHSEDNQRETIVRRLLSESVVQRFDIILNTKSGKPVDVMFSARPITLEGEKYILSTMIDVTEEKKLRRELQSLNERLELKVKERTVDLTNALEREKVINEIKSRFVTMASHEFRTPLATVLSSIALLEKYTEGEGNEKLIKHFDRIKFSVGNLTEILNEFISLEKIEKGIETIQNKSFLLPGVIEGGIAQLTERLKHGQKIKYSHAGDSEVFQDETKTYNASLNLISNAIKYSPVNSCIQVFSEVRNGEATITVKDQGIGIPDDEQENLFSLFFRAKNAAIIQGTGLGLCIVKNYMELMGGKITFTSRLNEGSTFVIRFPANTTK